MRGVSVRFAVMAAVSAFLCGVLVCGVIFMGMPGLSIRADADALTDEEESDLMQMLKQTIDIISRRSLHPADEEELLQAALDGVIAHLEDPYAALLDKHTLDSMMEDFQNRGYSGIGVSITTAPEGAVILSVFADGPADRAGLISGDVIIEVDATKVEGMSLSDIGSLIRGPESTTVDITVLRNGELWGPVPVAREEVVQPTVSFTKIELTDVTLGYVSIERFAESTPDEMEVALQHLEAADGVLIDLRSNLGGILSSAIRVAEQMVRPGSVLETVGREGTLAEYSSDTPGVDVPIVVLTDRNTASGAEIVAGALRDRQGALLVGDNTYGKGTVQSIFDLTGGGLRITTAEFVLPSGERIAGAGLAPELYIARLGGFRPGAGHLPVDEVLSPGDSGADVLELRRSLHSLGYGDEAPTPYFDAATRRTVALFQADHGLEPSGVADQATLAVLSGLTESALVPLLEYLDQEVMDELLHLEWMVRDRQVLQSVRVLMARLKGIIE